MNHKQRLGYMALGARILALGIIIGQWGTPNIEAQSKGVLDKITCRELEVVDAEGKKAVVLVSTKEGNGVCVYDKQERFASCLLSTMWGNDVSIYNRQGEVTVGLTSTPLVNSVSVYDKQGKEAISLSSTEKFGNELTITDQQTRKKKILRGK